MKTFRCPKGHVVKTAEPFWWRAFAVPENAWEEETTLMDSGPLCQVCFVQWMGVQFPTQEIAPTEGETDGNVG